MKDEEANEVEDEPPTFEDDVEEEMRRVAREEFGVELEPEVFDG